MSNDARIRKLHSRRHQILNRKRLRKNKFLGKKERMQLSRIERQIDRHEMREMRLGFEHMNRMVRASKAMTKKIDRLIAFVSANADAVGDLVQALNQAV